jgi:hypothetical protein
MLASGPLMTLLVACRASEAGPGSGITPPPGWQAMPSLATATSDAAKADGVVVDGAEAWGEPARGCFGAWLGLRAGARAPDAMVDALVKSLAAEKIEVRDVVKPAAGAIAGTMSLVFEQAPYHGKLRGQLLKDGHMTLLACFWNDREPVACETACTQLVGSLK